MSAGHNDPRLLYSVNNIKAYHLQNGEEADLNPSGPQTLSLLMVPTTSPFGDADHPSTAPEEDFYLHLHIPPELDLPLPATTQIYHQPPSSYLIPRWDLGPDSGAFTRIEFTPIGRGPNKVTQEDIDTFETILAQCTAFLERATPPKNHHFQYNPADYRPGEGYVGEYTQETPEKHRPGQIVLIDEEDGSVVGELSGGFSVVEATNIRPGSKNPVEIQLPLEGQGNQINVNNVSEDYLRMARHPAYRNSSIVQNAATASRLIVTGSTYLANILTSGANTFTQKTKPNPTPMTFTESTHSRVRKINTFSQSAAGLSAKTVGQVSRYAQNIGASLARKSEKDRRAKGFDKDGNPIPDYKPGVLNKSMMAFSTIADGIDAGARTLLQSSSLAATTVVGHRYGNEARTVAADIAGGAKNVGLVYIDAAGVSRKAVIKSVAKGMVVGRMPDGKNLVVGTGDGGVVPSDALGAYDNDMKKTMPTSNQDLLSLGPPSSEAGYGNRSPPSEVAYGHRSHPSEAGYGQRSPPSYGSGALGDPVRSPSPYGRLPEKR